MSDPLTYKIERRRVSTVLLCVAQASEDSRHILGPPGRAHHKILCARYSRDRGRGREVSLVASPLLTAQTSALESLLSSRSFRLIDVCEKRLGYRHALTMQRGGKVVTFKSFKVGARHLAPHVTVNQLILDGPHSIEFAPVEQKFLFKSGLVRLRQLAEQVSPDQIFALINFHSASD
jgi:hypothetical protein